MIVAASHSCSAWLMFLSFSIRDREEVNEIQVHALRDLLNEPAVPQTSLHGGDTVSTELQVVPASSEHPNTSAGQADGLPISGVVNAVPVGQPSRRGVGELFLELDPLVCYFDDQSVFCASCQKSVKIASRCHISDWHRHCRSKTHGRSE